MLMLIVLSTALTAGFPYIFPVLLLLLNTLSVKTFKVTGHQIGVISKHASYASMWSNADPEMCVIGRWFAGYIHKPTTGGGNSPPEKVLYLICTQSRFDFMTRGVEDPDSAIDYYCREGNFFHLQYTMRKLPVPNIMPKEHQVGAISSILAYFGVHDRCVCMIYGKPGTMKSRTAAFLCAEILRTRDEVALVDTWKPTDPGDTFDALYTKVSPSAKSPLVVVLEEFDGIVCAMHTGKVLTSKYIPVPIQNKTEWNQFFDKMNNGMFPHVIVLMTTNKDPEFFDSLDVSYIRAGRVDLKIEF